MNNKNIKFIFIINDASRNDGGKALQFLSKYKLSEHAKNKISFKENDPLKDIKLDGLIDYEHYFKGNNELKCLFFDGCTFGDTNSLSRREMITRLSDAIKKSNKARDTEWAFIRIKDYKGKKQTIGNLLTQYEKEEGQEQSAQEKMKSNQNKPSIFVSFMNFGRTIILNECFIDSRYTTFGNNITHEVINCFKTDKGDRYFYLCPSGLLNQDRFKRKPCNILPKQYVNERKLTYLEYSKTGQNNDGKTQYVFLRKAHGIELVDAAFKNKLDKKDYSDVNYGKVNICSIFNENSYSKNQDDNSTIFASDEGKTDAVEAYVSFKLRKSGIVERPKEQGQANISSGEEEMNKRLAGTTMRQFVIEGTPFYDCLVKKIKSIKWKKDEAPKFEEYEKIASEENIPDSIFGIIGRETRENYYSNLFAYIFLKYPEILNRFLHKAGINKKVDADLYVVERESKNIDILIKNKGENNKFLIVIENKISAAFNIEEEKKWYDCISANSKKKYKKTIDNLKEQEEKHPSKKPDSQLSKYYWLARYIAQVNGFQDDDEHKHISYR